MMFTLCNKQIAKLLLATTKHEAGEYQEYSYHFDILQSKFEAPISAHKMLYYQNYESQDLSLHQMNVTP